MDQTVVQDIADVLEERKFSKLSKKIVRTNSIHLNEEMNEEYLNIS